MEIPDHVSPGSGVRESGDPTAGNVLEINDLVVTMTLRQGEIRPVDGVSLNLRRGEIVALVGESGCGKTTVALAVAALLPRFASIASGQILLEGEDLGGLKPSKLRKIRGAKVGTVFQDPMSSLDPCFTIGDQITEVLRAHRKASRAEISAIALSMLDAVGLPTPARQMKAYPHQLSGGMRQRVGIALALVARPAVLLADEPTTALDVTLQQQILELLRHLRDEFGFSVLFITHDLGVVDEIADRMAVMYCGQIVESGPVEEVLLDPRHPYTQGLLRSMPGLTPPRERVTVISGSVPDLQRLPVGCRFDPRCPNRLNRCAESVPQLEPLADRRSLRCYNPTTFSVPE